MGGIKIETLWEWEESPLIECEVWWKVGTKVCEVLADEKKNTRVLVRRLLRSLIFFQGVTEQKEHQEFKHPMTWLSEVK